MKQLIKQNEQGFIMVWALLLLVIVTLLGVAGVSTSIFETKMAANQALHKQSFYQADGGTENGLALLKHNITCISGFSGGNPLDGDIDIVSTYENLWMNSYNDMPMASDSNRHFYYPSTNGKSLTPPYANGVINGYSEAMKGANIPQLGGYEGLAKSSGSGGVFLVYDIKVSHKGLRNSNTNIAIVYRVDNQFSNNPAGNCIY